MENLNFIESADHDRKAYKKSLRKATILILICAVPAAVSKLFFWEYTRWALVKKRGMLMEMEVGWPATIYSYGSIFAMAFLLIYIYIRFRHDMKQPSFGVTGEGVFINQQMLRNAFIPWSNIQDAELLGPAKSPFMRLTFNDYKVMIKG